MGLEMIIQILRIMVWNHLVRRFESIVKGRDLDEEIVSGEEEEAEDTDEEEVESVDGEEVGDVDGEEVGDVDGEEVGDVESVKLIFVLCDMWVHMSLFPK